MKNFFIAFLFGILIPMTSYADTHMEEIQLKIENQLLILKAELKTAEVKLKISPKDEWLKVNRDSIKQLIDELKSDLKLVKETIKSEEKYFDKLKDFNEAEEDYNKNLEKYNNIVSKYTY